MKDACNGMDSKISKKTSAKTNLRASGNGSLSIVSKIYCLKLKQQKLIDISDLENLPHQIW